MAVCNLAFLAPVPGQPFDLDRSQTLTTFLLDRDAGANATTFDATYSLNRTM